MRAHIMGMRYQPPKRVPWPMIAELMKCAMAAIPASGSTYPVTSAWGMVVSAAITSHSVLGVMRMFLTRSIRPMAASLSFLERRVYCTPARDAIIAPMESPQSIVEIRGLRFSYGRRPVLRGIDLDIPSGKVVAILGISGSGKTTLLQLIGGLLRPSGGHVTVCGKDVHELDPAGVRALRRRMGMMFQKGGLFTDLTVHENVAFPIREHTNLPE